jgi:hypothetical protein
LEQRAFHGRQPRLGIEHLESSDAAQFALLLLGLHVLLGQVARDFGSVDLGRTHLELIRGALDVLNDLLLELALLVWVARLADEGSARLASAALQRTGSVICMATP